MNLYRNILKQAGQITWRYKFLWFFGLFATFLGSFGGYEILVNRTNANFAQGFFDKIERLKTLGVFDGSFFTGAVSSFKAEPITTGISIVILLILLVLFIFVVWLAVASQVGLVSSSAQVFQNPKKATSLNIGKGIEKGTEKFWPILGVNIFSKIIIYGIFFGLSLLFLWGAPYSGQLFTDILYMILFIIFIPIALVVAFILNYAICYVTIEDKDFLESIKQGWDLFVKNWLVSLEMALILFFVTFVASLIGIIISFLIAIPLYLLLNLLTLLSADLSFWFMIVAMLLLALFVAFVGAIITTFKISSWTNLFLQLRSKKGGVSKILRMAENIKK